MYRPEASLVAGRALAQSGAHAEATTVFRSGSDWIRSHALPQVPVPFLDSFLNRNPVNRDLLAAAARLTASTPPPGLAPGALAPLPGTGLKG
jgi:hypothetical protein